MAASPAAHSGAALALAAGLALSCGTPSAPPEAPSRPSGALRAGERASVILVTLDTTRADYLGCYGHPRPISPRLDQLATEGTLFENAISQAASTAVSHASILTGLHPYHHGLRIMHGHRDNLLATDRTTLAELLLDSGYHTAAFVSAFPVSRRFGLDQGFELFDQDFLKDPAHALVDAEGIVNTGRSQRRADTTTDLALRWLEEAPEPLLLWLHYFDPHDTLLLPPDELVARLEDAGTPAERMRRLYELEIEYMDSQLGRVLDWLQERGRADRTVVAVIADHGEGLGDHGWWSHGILYQEQIRVPLILRGPGIPAGVRVSQPVRSIDLLPTLLELVGVPSGNAPDGSSLTATWSESGPGEERTSYSDALNLLTYRVGTVVPGALFTDEKNERLFALSQGRWKYIHHLDDPRKSELYDLQTDPGEQLNVVKQHPTLVRTFLEEFKTRDVLPPGAEASSRSMTEQERERLRSLGYLD